MEPSEAVPASCHDVSDPDELARLLWAASRALRDETAAALARAHAEAAQHAEPSAPLSHATVGDAVTDTGRCTPTKLAPTASMQDERAYSTDMNGAATAFSSPGRASSDGVLRSRAGDATQAGMSNTASAASPRSAYSPDHSAAQILRNTDAAGTPAADTLAVGHFLLDSANDYVNNLTATSQSEWLTGDLAGARLARAYTHPPATDVTEGAQEPGVPPPTPAFGSCVCVRVRDRDWLVPASFGVVERGVLRSAYPSPEALPALAALRVRTVINLLDKRTPAYDAWMHTHTVTYVHAAVKGNKAHCEEMDRSVVRRVLSVIMDTASHPVLIHCRSGKHRTGAVIGCLRMLQKWSLDDACAEYVEYCRHKQRDVDKHFIEHFDPRTLRDVAPPVSHFPDWLPHDCCEGQPARVHGPDCNLPLTQLYTQPHTQPLLSPESTGAHLASPESCGTAPQSPVRSAASVSYLGSRILFPDAVDLSASPVLCPTQGLHAVDVLRQSAESDSIGSLTTLSALTLQAAPHPHPHPVAQPLASAHTHARTDAAPRVASLTARTPPTTSPPAETATHEHIAAAAPSRASARYAAHTLAHTHAAPAHAPTHAHAHTHTSILPDQDGFSVFTPPRLRHVTPAPHDAEQ